MSMNKRLLFPLFLMILSLFPLRSLLSPGLPVTHDGQDHVARIANFYQSLSEGNIIPRWGNNLNWGFGHPVLMFLYPLPSYIASFFHAIGFSLVDSVKLVFAFGYAASILAMYWFVKDFWGTIPGIVAAILYGFAPYRFVNLYVRGAIGEHVSFIFLPLILWGIADLARKKRKILWGLFFSLSLAGLLLSHNAVSIMMIPCIVFFVLYMMIHTKQKKRFLVFVFLFGMYSVLLSAFFLFPAFFEGKYTLRDIVTKGEIGQRMVPFASFLRSPWNYGGGNEFTKEIGMPMIILFFLTIFIKKKGLIFGLWAMFCGYLVLMTSPSLPIWEKISLLQKFQFPWRLLVMTTFIGSLIGASVIVQVRKRYQSILGLLLCVIAVVSTAHMWKPKAYKTYDESFFTGVYKSTTDTGESSPIWSVRFMEFEPSSHMEIAEGNAIIKEQRRITTMREYHVIAKERTRLVENTLYFPGWNVFVNNQRADIEFQDPRWRGRITFWVDQGEHAIRIVFQDTKFRMISTIVSMASVILLFPLLILARQ